jgi:hypothetical protein
MKSIKINPSIQFGIVAFLSLILNYSAQACSTEEYIGSVCLVSFNFCPENFLIAAGQTLPINSNQALFSLISNQYGGDGKTTFKLPDLRKQASALGAGMNYCIATAGMYPPRP